MSIEAQFKNLQQLVDESEKVRQTERYRNASSHLKDLYDRAIAMGQEVLDAQEEQLHPKIMAELTIQTINNAKRTLNGKSVPVAENAAEQPAAKASKASSQPSKAPQQSSKQAEQSTAQEEQASVPVFTAKATTVPLRDEKEQSTSLGPAPTITFYPAGQATLTFYPAHVVPTPKEQEHQEQQNVNRHQSAWRAIWHGLKQSLGLGRK
ncbi:FIVAR domain-containing protein [Limosilactobacillus kribbianus]|uniref:FIVAR domain-containing protein n=1 Tax=Limosilactobacillus kribbianus TaxID=2982695 RepID=UPI00226469CF|nr:FIVAR domain-containing protein [Limosilactobacillus kribbianus]